MGDLAWISWTKWICVNYLPTAERPQGHRPHRRLHYRLCLSQVWVQQSVHQSELIHLPPLQAGRSPACKAFWEGVAVGRWAGINPVSSWFPSFDGYVNTTLTGLGSKYNICPHIELAPVAGYFGNCNSYWTIAPRPHICGQDIGIPPSLSFQSLPFRLILFERIACNLLSNGITSC